MQVLRYDRWKSSEVPWNRPLSVDAKGYPPLTKLSSAESRKLFCVPSGICLQEWQNMRRLDLDVTCYCLLFSSTRWPVFMRDPLGDWRHICRKGWPKCKRNIWWISALLTFLDAIQIQLVWFSLFMFSYPLYWRGVFNRPFLVTPNLKLPLKLLS